MVNKNIIAKLKLKKIIEKYPYTESFFTEQGINHDKHLYLSLDEIYAELSETEKNKIALEREDLLNKLINYIEQMQEFLGQKGEKVETLTLLPGQDKKGNPENFSSIDIQSGEIVSIVGPTGAGKSRLLADIEWAARGDTPTGRHVLINDEKVDREWRLSGDKNLVAQLSQNMNFVMDLPVREFLHLHAESRLVENEDQQVDKIIEQANQLAGESFSPQAQITGLSGGQSRALMISDTAILSSSPIILIDEIENAGINREKALDLLVDEDKIVLMVTHDPILALMGDKRIIIEQGGIVDLIDTSVREKKLLRDLKKIDHELGNLRERLRTGSQLARSEELLKITG